MRRAFVALLAAVAVVAAAAPASAAIPAHPKWKSSARLAAWNNADAAVMTETMDRQIGLIAAGFSPR